MPLVHVLFSSSGTRRFIHQDDVSIPQGDPEDWIEFTPYTLPGGGTASMTASLGCSGNGSLVVELWQDGAQLPDWGTLACGATDYDFLLSTGGTYQFRFYPAAGNGLQYVHYHLTLRNDP
jgi:hypothetical protein